MLRMFMFVLAFVTFGIANAEAKDIKVEVPIYTHRLLSIALQIRQGLARLDAADKS